MPSLSFSMEGDAPDKLRALSMAAQSRAGMNAGASAVRKLVMEHFLGLPSNAKGFPSSHFWAGAARSVVKRVDGDNVSVAATQVGVRRRYFGTDGPITPGQYGNSDKTYFAVPNQPETYGKYASDFPRDSMKFAFAQDENGQVHAALVPKGTALLGGETAARGDRHGSLYPVGTVMYWLYRTINQAPNHAVLPTADEMYDVFSAGILSYIRARLHNPGITLQLEDSDE